MKNKSRLQAYGKFIICTMVFTFIYTFTMLLFIKDETNFYISALQSLGNLYIAIGTIASLTVIRYGVRESILSKSNPDMVGRLIEESKEVKE